MSEIGVDDILDHLTDAVCVEQVDAKWRSLHTQHSTLDVHSNSSHIDMHTQAGSTVLNQVS